MRIIFVSIASTTLRAAFTMPVKSGRWRLFTNSVTRYSRCKIARTSGLNRENGATNKKCATGCRMKVSRIKRRKSFAISLAWGSHSAWKPYVKNAGILGITSTTSKNNMILDLSGPSQTSTKVQLLLKIIG